MENETLHIGSIREAAKAIKNCRSILITAGAGMGVDSGLPDFRGPEGFWRAYPPMKELGLRFEEMSTPRWFHEDPALAWGFFGHRLNLYRQATPHRGYEILREWTKDKPHFIFTSNVDGQFTKAGLNNDAICECHGTIHMLQCSNLACTQPLWTSDAVDIDVDETTFRARGGIPHCPTCGAIARPNILMFDDTEWQDSRSQAQLGRMSGFLQNIEAPLVIIEVGAGKGVPTVRRFSENILNRSNQTLIRINPREAEGPPGTISLDGGAAEMLEKIAETMKS